MSVRSQNRALSKSTLITTIRKYVLLVQMFEKAVADKGMKFVSKDKQIVLEPIATEEV